MQGLPCAPGPATTRRGMLVTNGQWLLVRPGVQVRAVQVRVVQVRVNPRTTISKRLRIRPRERLSYCKCKL